mmetsp:Transcript_32946/g.68630  ORF Transcript_32946/g.68630 Transcript_32946/m.68630 type:complete len:151 (+) Transcript_32946:711-1163(+)
MLIANAFGSFWFFVRRFPVSLHTRGRARRQDSPQAILSCHLDNKKVVPHTSRRKQGDSSKKAHITLASFLSREQKSDRSSLALLSYGFQCASSFLDSMTQPQQQRGIARMVTGPDEELGEMNLLGLDGVRSTLALEVSRARLGSRGLTYF